MHLEEAEPLEHDPDRGEESTEDDDSWWDDSVHDGWSEIVWRPTVKPVEPWRPRKHQ